MESKFGTESRCEGNEIPKPFLWREWVSDPEDVNEEVATLLDILEATINDDSDPENMMFRSDVYSLDTKMQSNAIVALSGNLRHILTNDERGRISEEVQRVGVRIPYEHFDT